MANARNIITLALESMNKLSPGEALDADLSAACLRRLNSIADDWSAGRDTMFRDVLTGGAVSGVSLTLGSGLFSGIAYGQQPAQLMAENVPMSPISMAQYQNITAKTTTGTPQLWAWDGGGTVYLYPAPNGQTISVLTREKFSQFADLDTEYSMPPGFAGAFAASLAVAMAPALVGQVTADLMAAKRSAMFKIVGATVRPAIINTDPLSCRSVDSTILLG